MEAAGVEAAMAVYGGGGRVTTDVKATAIMDQLNGLETGRWRPPGPPDLSGDMECGSI